MTTVIKSIGSGKTYSTIASWIASLSDGTYSSGDDVIGELYDSSYDETFNIGDDPFDTGGLDSVTLRANSSYKHDGTPDSGVKIVYSGSVSDATAPYTVSYNSSTVHLYVCSIFHFHVPSQIFFEIGVVTSQFVGSSQDHVLDYLLQLTVHDFISFTVVILFVRSQCVGVVRRVLSIFL